MQLEWPITVAHRIDQMINQYPNSTALKDGYGRVLTYAAMDKRVENIAHALHEQLHENDKQAIVGVFQMPSADWICSLLAIHRIGAIYLPLDLRNSIPRLKSNITRAKPAAILTDSDMMGLTDQIGIDEHMAVINVSDLMTIEREKRETAAKPNTSAYIIFTSGSTGEPKGSCQYATEQICLLTFNKVSLSRTLAYVSIWKATTGRGTFLTWLLLSSSRLHLASTHRYL